MSIRNEYLGFLSSFPLWEEESLFEIPLFDFEGISTIPPQLDEEKFGLHENEVLGKRIESFFDFYIKKSERYRTLVKNKQVFDNRVTIGELDFIQFDQKENSVLHVEFVYKFYLYNCLVKNELNRWVGPNMNDTLINKIEKLKNKQFPLLYKDETREILDNLGIRRDSIQQKIAFMGCLFVPLSMHNQKVPYLNNNCIVGFWLKSESFVKEVYGAFQFFIPIKKDWIVNPKNCNDWLTYKNARQQIEILLFKKRSPLVWMKISKTKYQRFFIVWW
ncbi:DUF1853 family protein [Aquimarina sp. 2201CG1-2-11]|uniref:DUF1853 family protein n=1 Tax=Aquimarina discodermiae TaxID=3231043 RepID=UPI0034621EB9